MNRLTMGYVSGLSPLGADGSEIINRETDEAFYADSHEFFLVKDRWY